MMKKMEDYDESVCCINILSCNKEMFFTCESQNPSDML